MVLLLDSQTLVHIHIFCIAWNHSAPVWLLHNNTFLSACDECQDALLLANRVSHESCDRLGLTETVSRYQLLLVLNALEPHCWRPNAVVVLQWPFEQKHDLHDLRDLIIFPTAALWYQFPKNSLFHLLEECSVDYHLAPVSWAPWGISSTFTSRFLAGTSSVKSQAIFD